MAEIEMVWLNLSYVEVHIGAIRTNLNLQNGKNMFAGCVAWTTIAEPAYIHNNMFNKSITNS